MSVDPGPYSDDNMDFNNVESLRSRKKSTSGYQKRPVASPTVSDKSEGSFGDSQGKATLYN